jgi:hypothetical protein
MYVGGSRSPGGNLRCQRESPSLSHEECVPGFEPTTSEVTGTGVNFEHRSYCATHTAQISCIGEHLPTTQEIDYMHIDMAKFFRFLITSTIKSGKSIIKSDLRKIDLTVWIELQRFRKTLFFCCVWSNYNKKLAVRKIRRIRSFAPAHFHNLHECFIIEIEGIHTYKAARAFWS